MKKSAGILLYRIDKKQLQLFLVHPGGPIWKNKDLGAWTIPKGELLDDELPLDAAKREFQEETGNAVNGNFIELNPIKQKSGKQVFAWAIEGNINPENIVSNTCKIEWPYKSGKWQRIPEVDKGAWFNFEEACNKINQAQVPFLIELTTFLKL